MLPQITVFGVTISLYGAWILVGLFHGIIIAVVLGKRISLIAEDVLFSSLFGIIGLVVGGKLLYLLTNAQLLWEKRAYILGNKTALTQLFGGGFVFYGGLFGAVLMVGIYCRKYKLPFGQMAVAICPVIPLIHAFGRIGCFFAGCCYGIPYSGIGHVIFTKAIAAPNQIALLPVQLLEAAVNIMIFFILLHLAWRKKRAAIIISTYCISYGCARFLLEYLRGDSVRGFYFGFSTSQWFSLLLILAGMAVLLRNRREG